MPGTWVVDFRLGGIPVLLSAFSAQTLTAENTTWRAPGTHPAPPLSTAQYFASTMIIVGLSVVVTVIVLQYHHHDPDGGKMPKWVRFPCPPQGELGPFPKEALRMTYPFKNLTNSWYSCTKSCVSH